eukprot:1156149-Pelagomonas_calceolata.AAC.10
MSLQKKWSVQGPSGGGDTLAHKSHGLPTPRSYKTNGANGKEERQPVLQTHTESCLVNATLPGATPQQGEREQEAERRGVVQSLCSNGRMAERAAASLQKGQALCMTC